jgi:hypothetical protein
MIVVATLLMLPKKIWIEKKVITSLWEPAKDINCYQICENWPSENRFKLFLKKAGTLAWHYLFIYLYRQPDF